MKRILVLLLLLSSICLGSNITDNNTSSKLSLVCIDSKLYIEDPKLNVLTTTGYDCNYDGDDLKIDNIEPVYVTIARMITLISLSLSASLVVLSAPLVLAYGLIKDS